MNDVATMEAKTAEKMGFRPVMRRLRLEATCVALREHGHCDREEIQLH